ncbi:MAG: hypothetical protein AAF736_06770, partial [Pseudomonadota bacterium]
FHRLPRATAMGGAMRIVLGGKGTLKGNELTCQDTPPQHNEDYRRGCDVGEHLASCAVRK